MARDCATAYTPKQGLFRKPWELPLSLLLISQSPLSLGSFGIELPLHGRGWLAAALLEKPQGAGLMPSTTQGPVVLNTAALAGQWRVVTVGRTDVPVAARQMNFLSGIHLFFFFFLPVFDIQKMSVSLWSRDTPTSVLVTPLFNVCLATEMANLAAGPARTSQLSLTQELFFVFIDLPLRAAWAPCLVCMERCVLVGVLTSSLWLDQKYWRCQDRDC